MYLSIVLAVQHTNVPYFEQSTVVFKRLFHRMVSIEVAIHLPIFSLILLPMNFKSNCDNELLHHNCDMSSFVVHYVKKDEK
jgi:hypothetical protein